MVYTVEEVLVGEVIAVVSLRLVGDFILAHRIQAEGITSVEEGGHVVYQDVANSLTGASKGFQGEQYRGDAAGADDVAGAYLSQHLANGHEHDLDPLVLVGARG